MFFFFLKSNALYSEITSFLIYLFFFCGGRGLLKNLIRFLNVSFSWVVLMTWLNKETTASGILILPIRKCKRLGRAALVGALTAPCLALPSSPRGTQSQGGRGRGLTGLEGGRKPHRRLRHHKPRV